MSSENALTTLDFGQIQTRKTNLTKYGSAGGKFLRRIQLCGGYDKYSKTGKIAVGHFGVPVSAEEITDLGPSVDLLLLAVRDKVLDMNVNPPLAVYDPANEEYQRVFWETYDYDAFIEAGGEVDENNLPASAVPLTVIPRTGTVQGPSFLVIERSTGQFYELFMSNVSGREEAKRMEVFLPIDAATAAENGVEQRGPIPCRLEGKYIEGKKHQWWAPESFKCSEEFTDLPDMAVIAAEIQKFMEATIEGGEDQGEEIAEGERKR